MSLDEAADSIGVSRDHFETYVRPHLRIVPVGRRVLVPVKAIEDYLERQAIGA